jgi:hypothetical protein
MSLLSPNPVQASLFTWDAPTRTFSADISDLPGRGFGRVWDDACDEGLTLISRFPGRQPAVFAVSHEERDRDGDVRWWDLSPADPRRDPGFAVRIWND